MPAHTLHKRIGDLLRETFSDNIPILDSACGDDQHIPLFIDEKSRETQYCQVDALSLSDEKDYVRVIIEIEETDRNPVKLFGKLFASTFSKYYIPENAIKPIRISDDFHFIQIVRNYKKAVNGVNAMGKTSPEKLLQLENLRESIKQIL